MGNRLLTVNEAAELLGRTPQALYPSRGQATSALSQKRPTPLLPRKRTEKVHRDLARRSY